MSPDEMRLEALRLAVSAYPESYSTRMAQEFLDFLSGKSSESSKKPAAIKEPRLLSLLGMTESEYRELKKIKKVRARRS